MSPSPPIIGVVGGGPAGLAAALALSRVRQSAILFDSGVYRNARAEHMHNVLGFDGKSPADFRATVRKEIAAYGLVDFVDNYIVKSAKRLDDGRFELDGRWTVDKIVLATGVRDIAPPIPGYDELWGIKIHHCVFCHGWEERDKPGAVLGLSSFVKGSFLFQQITSKLSILLDGIPAPEPTDTSPAGVTFTNFKQRGGIVHPHKIARLEDKPAGGLVVHFAAKSGAEPLSVDFLAHGPETALASDLADQLGCETIDGGNLRVSMMRETTVPGVFGAGDVSEVFKAVLSGALGGGIAAAGIVHGFTQAGLGFPA